ncbi:alpha/beta fold hydrolase [Quadrisphaera sp. DSM 44207]|uniref:alpha/beta fold hydrolase n=1 Tax=Quadrisphaera sp. DSM 44207 TaxID=1881057 RepID=UPI00088A753F|nr:alpha/beta fold hydrolase [Quadrisphaera sp. DSM 44207]SDQ52273.1 Pimeloyl-ACP methyl ester carboxylesterase [Quadrisphaera sp. DSM 44207]
MVAGGRSDGPTVVLVHGIGVSRRYFAPLARELSTRARVLAVDLPGFGGAPGPLSLSVPEHAGAVRRALEPLGVRGALLVGHSMGCQVVAHLVRGHPHLAAGAVLIGPTVDERARSAPRQALRLLRDSAAEPVAFNAVLVREYLRCGPRRYLATAAHMLADRIEEVLPAAAVPVLVLRGAHDPIAPRHWTEHLARRAPLGRAAQLDGGRHGIQWSHPQEVARACLELVRA